MVRTAFVIMTLLTGLSYHAVAWEGALPQRLVDQYSRMILIEPESPSEWLVGEARFYGLSDKDTQLVVGALLNDSTPDATSLSWSKVKVQDEDCNVTQKLFALAILSKVDRSVLEPFKYDQLRDTGETPAGKARNLVDRISPFFRLMEESVEGRSLGSALLSYLKGEPPQVAIGKSLKPDLLDMLTQGLNAKLTEEQIREIDTMIRQAQNERDEITESWARKLLFHQTGELSALTEGMGSSPLVQSHMLSVLTFLNGNSDATRFLIEHASTLLSKEIRAQQLSIEQALTFHTGNEVMDYLSEKVNNESAIAADEYTIARFLFDNRSNSKARDALITFYNKQYGLIYRIENMIKVIYDEKEKGKYNE